MTRPCAVCGNEYDKAAPRCAHCGCSIIGHGSEAHGVFYCSAHCAAMEKVTGVVDRV